MNLTLADSNLFLGVVVLAGFFLVAHGVGTLGKKSVLKPTPGGLGGVGEGRIMSKKYSWELDERAMLAKSSFPIRSAALIEKAKQVIERDILDPQDLSEDFVFQFPVVGPLSKEEYLKAVGGFQIKTMFPDMNLGIHNFHVDPLNPARVVYTVSFSATNSGDGPFGPATGIRVDCPPQVNSLTFNAKGQVVKYTGGYVVDRTYEGNNSGGMGGLFGPLYAIGKGFPFPEAKPYSRSWQFRLFSAVGNTAGNISKLFSKE